MPRGTPRVKKTQKDELREKIAAPLPITLPFAAITDRASSAVSVLLKSSLVTGTKRLSVNQIFLDHLIQSDGTFGEQPLVLSDDEKLQLQIIWIEENIEPDPEEYLSEPPTPSPPPVRHKKHHHDHHRHERKTPAPQQRVEIRTEAGHMLPQVRPTDENIAGYITRTFKPGAGKPMAQPAAILASDLLPQPAQGESEQPDSTTLEMNMDILPMLEPAPSWFSRTSVDDREREVLGEFFVGNSPVKNPVNYLTWRNFIVDAYEARPTEYLTFTAVRRAIPCDVCAVQRMFEFLESTGVINRSATTHPSADRLGPQPLPKSSVPADFKFKKPQAAVVPNISFECQNCKSAVTAVYLMENGEVYCDGCHNSPAGSLLSGFMGSGSGWPTEKLLPLAREMATADSWTQVATSFESTPEECIAAFFGTAALCQAPSKTGLTDSAAALELLASVRPSVLLAMSSAVRKSLKSNLTLESESSHFGSIVSGLIQARAAELSERSQQAADSAMIQLLALKMERLKIKQAQLDRMQGRG
ncbi:SWIRM domain [Carpediemonas membranifera]|uniref:SWIRM domain n=1 Tax=Carpediemonas membranifera TaxID=201153 RepID=A0A8J6ASX5_9EUKA|nr:SWIRM domain [Carpediemonas membranifera]|eukprot:KAG9393691.1 SWIRM domain [Carpediemonas membranifera]